MASFKRISLCIISLALLALILIVNYFVYELAMQHNNIFMIYLAIIGSVVSVIYAALFNWQLLRNHWLENKSQSLQTQFKSVLENTTELRNQLTYEMQVLGIHNEKMTLLIELSEIVQACNTIAEATKALLPKCSKILHFADGTLYITNPETQQLEIATHWGDPTPQLPIIHADQCWALRTGGMYQVKNPQSDLICEHVVNPKTTPQYLCLPLMAQNAIYGMLHLDLPANTTSLTDENKLLISAVTETLALAFANINLRETLRNQTLHDSLTGVYNRRYLNEFITKEINTAFPNETHLAVIMLDLDFFKEFNDTYGHEAGDLMLEEVGKLFQNEVRTNDFACRYGGEEFLIVLTHCNLENAKKRCNDILIKIAHLTILYRNQKLGGITASIGIAMYPRNGTTMSDLIDAADKALYRAKESRNKVVVYSDEFSN